jgi:hypothetical protein
MSLLLGTCGDNEIGDHLSVALGGRFIFPRFQDDALDALIHFLVLLLAEEKLDPANHHTILDEMQLFTIRLAIQVAPGSTL